MLPKVSIVVTAYLPESKPYLDNCIASIKNLNYPSECIETLIVTPRWYIPEYEGCKTIHPCYGAYHNPVAVNYGMSEASKDSKHLFMINDDVILTRDCLKNLVNAAGDSEVCLGAISNCDNYGHYQLMFPGNLHKRQYRLEEIAHVVPQMMNAQSSYPAGVIFPQTLYLYANLFPRKVWEKVGPFDEEFKTGFDDTDWCMRARQSGIGLGICLDSLVWHCSGASADKTMGDLKSDLRAQNEAYFKRKWGMA